MRVAPRSLVAAFAILTSLVAAFASLAQVGGAAPVIPYRGVLQESGVPVDGTVAMTFRLYGQASGGSALATLPMAAVEVTDGHFAVDIAPIPTAAFAAGTLYLEIDVEGSPLGGRQPLRPSTYSVRGAPASDFFVDGRLGVGTAAPASKAHVDSGELRVRASHNTQNQDIATFLAGNQTQGVGISFDGIAAVGNNPSQHLRLNSKGPDGRVFVQSPFIATEGALVQGTLSTGVIEAGAVTATAVTTPGAVTSASGIAPGAGESVAIVRGTIAGNATVARGAGFSVSRPSSGVYLVTFNPPFSAAPTVVCSGHHPSIGATSGVVQCLVEHQDQVSASTARFIITAGDNSNANYAISFIAIGPR